MFFNTDVKYITSAMVGAPALKAQAGSLLTILKAFLQDGWGDATPVSAEALDGVLSITFSTAHAALPMSVVALTATGEFASALTQQFKVVGVDGAVIKVLVTEVPNGPVTGITNVKMAPAGFTRTFSATNVATYLSNRPDSHGMTLRINDASALFARVVGYETMTSVDTGTNPFPLNAQANGGGYWDKATEVSGLDIPYAIFSDGYSIIYCPSAATAGGNAKLAGCEAYFFGDTLEETPAGDPFATLLSCSPVETAYQPSTQYEGLSGSHYLTRPRSGGVGAIQALVGDYMLMDFGHFPDQVSGRVHATKRYVKDYADSNVRAEIPGLLNGMQTKVLQFLPQFSLVKIDGKYHMVIPAGAYDHSTDDDEHPVMYIDVVGPWLVEDQTSGDFNGDEAVQAFNAALVETP